MKLKEALTELRKSKERKFNQSIDIIVNLKGIDVKKENLSSVINVPHVIKEKKVCGFMAKKSDVIDTILEAGFEKYKDKKALKNLVKKYDFFVAVAPLMPKVATVFGKALWPAGKMPSPQLGILPSDNEAVVKGVLDKIAKSIKIRVKEPSIKTCIGRVNMKDEEIADNFRAFYQGIINMLPNKKEQIKNIMLKLTMSKPIRVEGE